MRLPKRFPRRSFALGSLAAAALVGALLPAAAQPRQAYWFTAAARSVTPLTQTFEGLVAAVVKASYPITESGEMRADALHRRLSGLSSRDLIFAAIDRDSLPELLRLDRGRDVLPTLGLEPMNVRVSAAPFYLFAQARVADALRQQSGAALRIVYVDKLGGMQPADVAGLLDPLLRARSAVVGPLDSPRELARRLLSGGADVVGIYDDDPSWFRNDFVTAYEELRPRGEPARLQAIKLVVFPTTDADYGADRLRLAANDLTYAIVKYEELAFNDAQTLVPMNPGDGLVAVAKASRAGEAADGLLLLTNLKRAVPEKEYVRVRRLLSYAHLAALFRADLAPVRCGGGSRTAYRAFLFNAHLADKSDLVKSLALWSDLKLAWTTATGVEQSQIQDQLDLVAAMLARQQNFQVLSKADWQSLASRLSAGTPLREQFSGQESTLYRQALESIRTALTETGSARRGRLTAARAKLVELIRKGVDPSCTVSGSEGLFSAREFDPFFYLGLIDAHLALEPAP